MSGIHAAGIAGDGHGRSAIGRDAGRRRGRGRRRPRRDHVRLRTCCRQCEHDDQCAPARRAPPRAWLHRRGPQRLTGYHSRDCIRHSIRRPAKEVQSRQVFLVGRQRQVCPRRRRPAPGAQSVVRPARDHENAPGANGHEARPGQTRRETLRTASVVGPAAGCGADQCWASHPPTPPRTRRFSHPSSTALSSGLRERLVGARRLRHSRCLPRANRDLMGPILASGTRPTPTISTCVAPSRTPPSRA